MPPVSDIMTTDVRVITPSASLKCAAQMMEEWDLGSLPVCEGGRLLGIVTDRDIAVRGTAAGLSPERSCVADVMTHGAEWCTDTLDVEVVRRVMADAHVRRMPVIDSKRHVVGILSRSDLP